MAHGCTEPDSRKKNCRGNTRPRWNRSAAPLQKGELNGGAAPARPNADTNCSPVRDVYYWLRETSLATHFWPRTGTKVPT